MNYAKIKPHDISNGTGIRVSLFVSGCNHGCKGCFNSEAWDFGYGKPYTEAQTEQILKSLEPDYIKGFSLLGGEPFDPNNQPTVLEILKRVKSEYPEKSVWCYTGYDLEKELLAGKAESIETVEEILGYIDILVDGRFVEELKNIKIKFRGSENQRIIDVKKSLKQGNIELWDGSYI
ncbi:MAG: anaerobic ribonucleoside-triphosphate reductase activating protein [Eubacteriales bacterium]|nr:anaerobic ribonucleoside-triphosphate reductase activating protein [Eubacteriales bacterium]